MNAKKGITKRFVALVYDLERLALACEPCKGTGTVWPSGRAYVCKECESLHVLLRRHKPYTCMDIYAKRGTKVVYHNPFNGYPGDIRAGSENLILGNEYTVDSTDVGSCHTNVNLVEVPRHSFNHALFVESPVTP